MYDYGSEEILAPKMKKFSGTDTSDAPWSGLKRDDELWLHHGDCKVYLYTYGRSKRSPVFNIPSSALLNAHCGPKFWDCCRTHDNDDGSSEASDFYQRIANESEECALYLGSPTELDKEQTLKWHITTRNFLAWLTNTPMVGERLSDALLAVLERMSLWRLDNATNLEDILCYCDKMQYTAGKSPNTCLAMLNFSDNIDDRCLWRESFAHCVALKDQLATSDELAPINLATRARIARAALQDEMNSDRMLARFSTLLCEDLATLPITSHNPHLDRFRTFLLSHFEDQLASLKLTAATVETTGTLRNLQAEFMSLYRALAARDDDHVGPFDRPEGTSHDLKLSIGNLNEKLELSPLSYSHPRPISRRVDFLGGHDSAQDFVQDYIRFEGTCVGASTRSVSPQDIRNTNWILIYGVVQTLNFLVASPAERQKMGSEWHLQGPTSQTPTDISRRASLRSISQSLYQLDIHRRAQSLPSPVEQLPAIPVRNPRRTSTLPRGAIPPRLSLKPMPLRTNSIRHTVMTVSPNINDSSIPVSEPDIAAVNEPTLSIDSLSHDYVRARAHSLSSSTDTPDLEWSPSSSSSSSYADSEARTSMDGPDIMSSSSSIYSEHFDDQAQSNLTNEKRFSKQAADMAAYADKLVDRVKEAAVVDTIDFAMG